MLSIRIYSQRMEGKRIPCTVMHNVTQSLLLCVQILFCGSVWKEYYQSPVHTHHRQPLLKFLLQVVLPATFLQSVYEAKSKSWTEL